MFETVGKKISVKKYIWYLIFSIAPVFSWSSTARAETGQNVPKSNYIVIWYVGAQDSALYPLLIAPKTPNSQEKITFHRDKGIKWYPVYFEFRVDRMSESDTCTYC